MQAGDAVVVTAEVAFDRAEHVQGVAHLRPTADLAGGRDGIAGEGERLEVAQLERRLVGDAAQASDDGERDARLDPVAKASVARCDVVRSPACHEYNARRPRMRACRSGSVPGIELGDQLIGELHGDMVTACERCDLGGVFEQPQAVDAGDRRRAVDAGPQLERPAVVDLRLDRSMGELGRLPRPHRRRQRLGQARRGVPVVRQLRCGQRGVVAERQLGMGGEAHRHTLVQGGPLPGRRSPYTASWPRAWRNE